MAENSKTEAPKPVTAAYAAVQKPIAPATSAQQVVSSPKTGFQRPATISISKPQMVTVNTVNQSVVQQVVQETLNERFTEEALVDSWRRFGKTISDDIRRMNFQNTNLPRVIAQNEFEVSVNNVMQNNELKKIQTDIIQFIGQDLKNTNIRMKIKVLEDNEMQRTVTPEQRYKKMADENPNLELLRKNLSLEID